MIKLVTILNEIKISNKIILNRNENEDDEDEGWKGYSLGNLICWNVYGELIIQFRKNYDLEKLKTILNKRKIPFNTKFYGKDQNEEGSLEIKDANKYFEFRD